MSNPSTKYENWLLVIAVLALAVLPLIFVKGEYGGADGQAEEAIDERHRRKRTVYHFAPLAHFVARFRSTAPFGRCILRAQQAAGNGPTEIQALTGDRATKAALLQRLPQARIIHLATHAEANDSQGLKSWIALAPAGKDRRLLTAEEIFNLYGPPQPNPLQAELIVLSACTTGRGQVTGDGVIGLSRSLCAERSSALLAGCKSQAQKPWLGTGYRVLRRSW